MNLHDIPTGRETPTPVIDRYDIARFAREMLNNPRPAQNFWPPLHYVTVRQPVRATTNPDDADYRPVLEHRAEPDDILIRLQDQWVALQRAYLRPRDLPLVTFVLSPREWDVLRRHFGVEVLQAAGFPMREGVELSYRGYRVVIVPDGQFPPFHRPF